ncbi:MAG: hypothetical protein ACXABY_11915 [Candidatus Thorarchaeota archaeon]|jgi:hypothetical protein
MAEETKTCTVPCEPIDEKLTEMKKCIDKVKKEKTPMTLFYWVTGGILAFCVVILGGAQWRLVNTISERDTRLLEMIGEIDTNVKVMKVTVESTKINLNRHLDKSEGLLIDLDKRSDDLERKMYRLENGRMGNP